MTEPSGTTRESAAEVPGAGRPTLTAQAARGAAISVGSQLTRLVLQIGAVAVLARLLLPSDFGTMTMVLAVAGLATLLGDFGLSMASMQAKSATHQQRSNLFWINTLIGAVASLAVFALAHPLSVLYDNPAVANVARTVAIIFLLQSMGAQLRAEMARRLQFGWSAAADLIGQTCGAVTAITMALLGFGYWSLAWQQVVIATVQIVVLSVAARWVPARPRKTDGMKGLLSFGAGSAGVQVLNYLTSNVDSVVLGRFAGAATLGVYNQAYQVFRIPLQQLAAPLTRVAVPSLARTERPEDYERYVLKLQSTLIYALGGAFALAAGAAHSLFPLWLGSGWEKAPVIFMVLAVGGVFQALGYIYYWVFLSKALTWVQLRIAVVSRTLMVALIVLGVHWGAVGVAAGAATGLALNWVLLTVFGVPRTGLLRRRLLSAAGRPGGVVVAVFAVTYGTGLIVRQASLPLLLQVVVEVAAGLLTLSLAALIVARVRQDFKDLLGLARSARSARRSSTDEGKQ